MFARLFAETGLSLDRLRALVEIGASGSIVKAAGGEAARQSLYSRQVKELEDFFKVPLLERHGRGVRLTPQGRELARISRFFLLGLSNFQRGCLAEGQVYRVAADATFNRSLLAPVIAEMFQPGAAIRFSIEATTGDEIERRLHDLTLDFGIVTKRLLSRPLQAKELGRWRLKLWVPASWGVTAAEVKTQLQSRQLPLLWGGGEPDRQLAGWLRDYEPIVRCGSFVEVQQALGVGKLAGFLPDFLAPEGGAKKFLSPELGELAPTEYCYELAWNPRLLRLNPHASRRRDALANALSSRLAAARRVVGVHGPAQ